MTIAAPSSVQPIPSWESVVGVGGVASGGTQVKDIGEYEFTLTRAIKPYFTNQGSQLPYVIARGKQGATGKLTFAPAISEAPLIAMLANTQPQLQFIVSNGLTGANLVSVQVDIGLAAYETADLQDGDELFGYEVPFKCVSTAASITGAQGSSMTGASGGKGNIKITLQNAIPTLLGGPVRHDLTSGAWVEVRPIGELKRNDKIAVQRLQFEGIPMNDGDIDWHAGALMPGGAGAINVRFGENRRNTAIALVVTAWSFDGIEVPQVRDGCLIGGDGIGELPLDDYDELEALIDPYIEKLTKAPDPKAPAAATTSSSNGRSSAKASSLKG